MREFGTPKNPTPGSKGRVTIKVPDLCSKRGKSHPELRPQAITVGTGSRTLVSPKPTTGTTLRLRPLLSRSVVLVVGLAEQVHDLSADGAGFREELLVVRAPLRAQVHDLDHGRTLPF